MSTAVPPPPEELAPPPPSDRSPVTFYAPPPDEPPPPELLAAARASKGSTGAAAGYIELKEMSPTRSPTQPSVVMSQTDAATWAAEERKNFYTSADFLHPSTHPNAPDLRAITLGLSNLKLTDSKRWTRSVLVTETEQLLQKAKDYNAWFCAMKIQSELEFMDGLLRRTTNINETVFLKIYLRLFNFLNDVLAPLNPDRKRLTEQILHVVESSGTRASGFWTSGHPKKAHHWWAHSLEKIQTAIALKKEGKMIVKPGFSSLHRFIGRTLSSGHTLSCYEQKNNRCALFSNFFSLLSRTKLDMMSLEWRMPPQVRVMLGASIVEGFQQRGRDPFLTPDVAKDLPLWIEELQKAVSEARRIGYSNLVSLQILEAGIKNAQLDPKPSPMTVWRLRAEVITYYLTPKLILLI
jgi:hypothetical protein